METYRNRITSGLAPMISNILKFTESKRIFWNYIYSKPKPTKQHIMDSKVTSKPSWILVKLLEIFVKLKVTRNFETWQLETNEN